MLITSKNYNNINLHLYIHVYLYYYLYNLLYNARLLHILEECTTGLMEKMESSVSTCFSRYNSSVCMPGGKCLRTLSSPDRSEVFWSFAAELPLVKRYRCCTVSSRRARTLGHPIIHRNSSAPGMCLSLMYVNSCGSSSGSSSCSCAKMRCFSTLFLLTPCSFFC
jgi:hypothetical protein